MDGKKARTVGSCVRMGSTVNKIIRYIVKLPGFQSANRLRLYSSFILDYIKFQRQQGRGEGRFTLNWKDRFPCIYDRTSNTNFDHHYIYHTAWAARVLAQIRPDHHLDISSSLYFCSLVSAFIPIRFFDYRPVELQLNNLTSEQADLTSLPFSDKEIVSLSCMHVVEHIGLGRYGDPLDPDGDLKAMSELQRVLAVGGSLLFVVPIGKPRIVFNAHRIYSYQQILDSFPALTLKEFTLITDNPTSSSLIYNAPPEITNSQIYGCGCFWLMRER